MLILAIVLAVFALALLWIASRTQRSTGLPEGRIIYKDTSRWTPLLEPLYAAKLGLTGKPDYLVRQGKQVIPVEVKTSRISGNPYDAHVYQLAAYCLLVESVYLVRPAYGILHYPHRTYKIPFTAGLESAVLSVLDEMRLGAQREAPDRSHESPVRCLGCGYNAICDQIILESL